MGLNFTGIRFTEIKSQVERFLQSEYKKANALFGVASPYGQILYVLENLHQLSMVYLKNTISNLDVGDANYINERVIRNAAIMAGHLPSRAISATGTIVVTVKPGTDLEREVAGSRITIFNKTRMQNVSNGLDYSMDLGNESVTHLLTPGYRFFINIVQGFWSSQTVTGAGSPLQTFSLSEPAGRNIENFRMEVMVNGEMWEIKRHLYDMIPDEKAVVIRSGFDDGVDVVFGNGAFGMMPPLGAPIVVRYLVTNGSDGNIFRRTRNDWGVVGTVVDGQGETVDIKKLFNIDFYTDINFGADRESFDFTRQMLPMVTNNAVLALPQHFAYEIKKLGIFSHVNAYERTGTIFITVTPNINLFKNPSANYFTIDKGAFVLDNYERTKINRYLKGNGLIQLTKKFKVITPKLSYYAINVFYISYSDATDDSVNAQILNSISAYFLNLNAMDRIPKVDIVKSLSNIADIHSVDVYFISKKNEDYHSDGIKKTNNLAVQYQTPSDYDATKVLGIDPVMGDMLFEPDELPIVRGDWYDRNGSYFNDDINSSGLRAVNIIKQGSTDVKFKNK
jgi:hypothetical protein